MSVEVVRRFCNSCGVKIKVPITRERFRCPKCQSENRLSPAIAGAKLPTASEAGPTTRLILSPSRGLSAAPSTPVIDVPEVQSHLQSDVAIKRLNVMLANGAVFGTVCALVVFFALPDFGIHGGARYLFAAIVFFAGRMGLLHLLASASSGALKRLDSSSESTGISSQHDEPKKLKTRGPGVLIAAAPASSIASFFAMLAVIGLGIVFGLVGLFLLSSTKKSVGVGAIGLAAAIVTLLAGIHVVLHWCFFASDAASRASSRKLLALQTPIVVILAVGFGLEYQTPGDSVVRVALARVSDGAIGKEPVPPKTESSVPKETKPPTFDATPWHGADFLLASGSMTSVGLQREASGFRVVAKAQGLDSKAAQMVAWNAPVPVIDSDRAVTRKVFIESPSGSLLSSATAASVQALLTKRPLLPVKAQLVSFHDKLNNVPRIGHAIGDANGEFDFIELIPRFNRAQMNSNGVQAFDFERIQRLTRVRAASEQRVLNDLSLRRSIDWLDYCLYQVVRTMNDAPKSPNRPGEPAVFVDNVYADVDGWSGTDADKGYGTHRGQRGDLPESGLKDLKQRRSGAESRTEAAQDKELANMPTGFNGILGSLFRQVADRENELRKRDVLKGRRVQLERELERLRARVEQCQGLIEEENRLTSDIRSRLVRVGIPLVERSARIEFALSGKGSVGPERRWRRPGADDAVTSNLVSASYVLLTELRPPEQKGRYQLSMRLVDVHSGLIVWEDQADRGDVVGVKGVADDDL